MVARQEIRALRHELWHYVRRRSLQKRIDIRTILETDQFVDETFVCELRQERGDHVHPAVDYDQRINSI